MAARIAAQKLWHLKKIILGSYLSRICRKNSEIFMLFSQIFLPDIHQFCWKSFTTMHIVLLGNFQKIPMFGGQIREKMDHLVYIYVHPATA